MPEIGAPHKLSHEDGGNDEISLLGLSGLLGDSQTPLAHKTSHQDTGTDEITVAGLAGRQILVPYNGKVADITQPDTNKHTLDLATALSETRKIISVMLSAHRMSGTGIFEYYPNEGNQLLHDYSDFYRFFEIVIANGTQRLQYSLDTPNGDFELYCFGYVVET